MTSEDGASVSRDAWMAAALCDGAGCDRRKAGENPRRKVSGGQLCAGCGSDLAADLAALPGLYDECGRVLGGTGRPREKTTGGGLPGMPFNAVAAEARSAILGILVSWCALVTEERSVTAPRRNVQALAAFLARHISWLAAHTAAGDMSREVAKVARDARWAAFGDPVRQVRVGHCVMAGCHGELDTTLRLIGKGASSEIVCSSDPSHRWASHEWLLLRRHLSANAPSPCTPDARRGRDSAGTADAAGYDRPGPGTADGIQWLTPAEVSQLWNIPLGSVYRLASEWQWRRHSRSGRAYYYAADVEEAIHRSGEQPGPLLPQLTTRLPSAASVGPSPT